MINAMYAKENEDLRKELDALKKGTQSSARLDQYKQGNSGFSLSGDEKEKQAAMTGLELGNTGYGQNLFEVGDDIQRVKELQRQRTEGSDPVSEAIRNQKAGAIATAQRNQAMSGFRGANNVGVVDEIARKHDADIAASLYGQQAQNISAERSLASNMLSGTTALMQGEKATGVTMPEAPSSSGGMSVICTELHRQGLLVDEIKDLDTLYGIKIRAMKPHVYVGYYVWARHVAALMKKSALFTEMVAFLAIPWACNMAGYPNFVGKIVNKIGEPICGIIGKLVIKFSK